MDSLLSYESDEEEVPPAAPSTTLSVPVTVTVTVTAPVIVATIQSPAVATISATETETTPTASTAPIEPPAPTTLPSASSTTAPISVASTASTVPTVPTSAVIELTASVDSPTTLIPIVESTCATVVNPASTEPVDPISTLAPTLLGTDPLLSDGFTSNNVDNKDDRVCAICLVGEEYIDNDILFCDCCDVAVHQLCYSVPKVPEGQWFCYVCEKGKHPDATVCELCSYTGGAYKMVADTEDKWAHPLCAAWIVEAYEVNRDGYPYLKLDSIIPQRYKLKCALCTKKGACAQCSFGRCTAAAHPWCVLHNPRGFKRRIVKGNEGEVLWEIFCRAHAKAVNEPIKPKHKSKLSQIGNANDERLSVADSGEFKVSKPIRNKSLSPEEIVAQVPSMDHARRTNAIDYLALGNYALDCESNRSSANVETDQYFSPKSGKRRDKISKSFPVFNLLEWPGQSEGEAMDLDHFWNVISMYYPEEHPAEWLAFMFQTFTHENEDESSFFTRRSTVKAFEPLPALPQRRINQSVFEELVEDVDEKVAALRTERDRSLIYYNDARLSLLSSVFKSIDVLSKNINGSIQPANGDMIVERILSNVSSFTEDEVYLKRPLGEDVVNKEQKGKSLRAVFDGMNRVGCEFTISDSNGTYQTNSDSVEEWSANNLLMPSRNDDQNNFSTDSLDVNGKTLNLVKFWRISQANSVYLSDKVVIPREEDDELARAVRESQLALKELDAVLQDNLHSIYSRDLCRSSGKMIERRDKWSKLEDIYVTQQVKKALCLSIEQGMKETSMHHNSWAQQVVPASWMLPVAGRPNDENEKDDDLPEDAICMCCFDGVSTDENKILFCDGCNCVIHQVCYGIKGVPEGDFFCDRCQYICLLCDELDDAIYSVDLRSAVMCCLCPVQHGALKPTTDSRWVHLCCAYWSENAVVKSLNSMGPVDITEVEVQSTDMASFGDNSPALCCFCNIPGGFVVNCTHSSNEANSEKCSAVFHPICAWFTGMYFNVNLSDRSFLSNSTGGNISEEMTFEYCCVLHSLERYGSSETLVEHKNYRQKYCMKPSDLDNIPGSRRKRKTHKKKEKPQSVSRKTSTTTSTQNKELNIDLYDTKYCAACYRPTSTDALMLGEEHDRITALANLPLYEELDVSRIVQECADSVSMAIPHELQAILSDKGKIDISSPLTDNEAPPQTNNDAPMKKEIITSLLLVDPISKVSAINQNGSTASVTSVNDKQSDALAMNGKQKQEKTSSTESIPSILSCKKCTLTIHRDCYIGSVEFPDKSNYSSWLCDNCKLITVPSESTTTQPPTCVLCPRRGGYVRITNEASTAHVYCAKACPGNTSVSTDGIIEMKSIAKEFKKQKCCICNRKSGVCIRCSTLGCDSYFHPICGIRSGKGYVHTRMGESVNFCSAHIPEGIVRLSSGHWIDGYEVQRLRYSLDRARIIFDVMLKREKLKRSWYKSQTEDFDSRFRRRLDQATGNKHNKDNDSVSHESTDESDNETLSEAGDDVVDENAFVELSRIPITSETSVYTIHDEDVEISGRWTNQAKDIVLPSSIVVALAGIEVKKKDTLLDGGLPRFLKETSSKIVKETDRIREYTGCFVSQRAADEFGRNLPGVVSSLVALPNDLFVKEMESFHVKAKLLMEKVKKSGGKKGYVLVEESPAPVEVQEVVEVVGGRRSRSVKSLSEDAVIIDGVEANDLALPSRENFLGRKRRRSAETEVTQPVPVIEAKESEKRKRSLSIKDLEEDTLPKKRRTSTTIDANPAATNLSEQLISPKRLKANKVKDISTPSNIEIENKMNKNSKFVKNGSTKRITDHFQPVTITPGQDLCKLERRLLDILNGLYAESPSFGIDNFTGQFASPRRLTTPSRENNTSMELTSTGNRRSRRLVLPGDTNQSNSGDHDEEMLLKDYMSVPEEISNAMEPQLILTLDTIKDALMNHLYPTIHSFTKDMNDMLNSNRVVYQSKKEEMNKKSQIQQLLEKLKRESSKSQSPYFHLLRWKGLDLALSEIDNKNEDSSWSLQCANCSKHFSSATWPSQFHHPYPRAAQDSTSNSFSSGNWAEIQLGKSNSTEFQFPDGYTIATKDSRATRKQKELAFRAQWDAAIEKSKNNPETVSEAVTPRRSSRAKGSLSEEKQTTQNITASNTKRMKGSNTSKNNFSWNCPSCLKINAAVIGSRVAIWWNDDQRAYTGKIDAYDSHSECHRILYDDGEWEFSDLSYEPYFLLESANSTGSNNAL